MGYFDGVRDLNQRLMMLEERYGSGVSHSRKQQLHGWRAERELARTREADNGSDGTNTLSTCGSVIAVGFGALTQSFMRRQREGG
ncbi:MAG: hypothetical protein DCO97_20005 [Marivita sp. XM-24bin2]|nr:MAG: hypothetical protein DCO97_20005 [Marivita sp. XM-24bin2]